MTPTNLECFRGETAEWELTATKNNVAIDLTGATVWMDVRRNYATPELFTKSSATTGVTIDPDQVTNRGKARIKLATTDTEVLGNQEEILVYGVWVQTPDGDRRVVSYGQLTVKPSA